MSSHHYKQKLFAELARVGKALGNANRLELLEFLAQGERNVEELVKLSGLTVANCSQHLQQLRQAGLIASRKEGQYVRYRLASDAVITLFVALRSVAEQQLAEVERLINAYLTVKDDLEPLSRHELLQRAREGLISVIDVRPEEEYRSGHLAGAINIPVSELQQRLTELDADQEIVAYCRGPHCILAFEAVARLRASGFQARRLQDGYPEWKAEGLPVESG